MLARISGLIFDASACRVVRRLVLPDHFLVKYRALAYQGAPQAGVADVCRLRAFVLCCTQNLYIHYQLDGYKAEKMQKVSPDAIVWHWTLLADAPVCTHAAEEKEATAP